MENKNTLSFKKLLTMGVTAVIVAMLFIPFPNMAIEIFLGIEAVYAVGILIYSFLKHRKAMPILVLIFAMFALAVNIMFTRAALLGYERGNQVPVVCIFAGLLGGSDYIVGFVIAVILMIVHVVIIAKGSARVVEVAARFSLDSINQKFFDTDEKLAENQISEEDAEKQRKAVRDECDYYASLDGASKFLRGSTKATLLIILVNLLGGFAVEKFKLGTSFLEGLEAAVKITTGNIVIFLLPSLIVSFALGLIATRNKK